MTPQTGSSAEDAETGASHEPLLPASPHASLTAHPSESRPPSASIPSVAAPPDPIGAQIPAAMAPPGSSQPVPASLVANDVSRADHAPTQSSLAPSAHAASAGSAAASTPRAASPEDLVHSRKRKRSNSPPTASTPSSSAPPVPFAQSLSTSATTAGQTPPTDAASQSLARVSAASPQPDASNALPIDASSVAPAPETPVALAASAAPTSIAFSFGGSSIAPLLPSPASDTPANGAARRQRLSEGEPRTNLAADPAASAQCLISSPSTTSIASAPPAKRMNRSRTPPAAATTTAESPPARLATLAPLPSSSPSSFNTTSNFVPTLSITSPLPAQSISPSSASIRTGAHTNAPSGSAPMSAADPASLADTPATRSVATVGKPDFESENPSVPLQPLGEPSAASNAEGTQHDQERPLPGAASISGPSASRTSSPSSPAATPPAAPTESSLLDRSSAASAAAKPVPPAAHPDSCDASNFQIPPASSSAALPSTSPAETHSASAPSAAYAPAAKPTKNSDLTARRQISNTVNIRTSSPGHADGGRLDDADLPESDLRSDASASDPASDLVASVGHRNPLAASLPSVVDAQVNGSQHATALSPDTRSPDPLAASTSASASSLTPSQPSPKDKNGGTQQAVSPSTTSAAVRDPAPPSQPASDAASDMYSDAAFQVHVAVESAVQEGASVAPSTLVPSERTTPSAQTPELSSTINTLQLASEALSSIPQDGSRGVAAVPSAAAELLIALHQRSKKKSAIRSPHPGSVRSRSAATTPVPPSLLLGIKNGSLDVTAQSSRATTPTRTPSGRAKRRRRERNAAATPQTVALALPSIESSDRRRSARVAKAVTTSASDNASTPNLAAFGFSPFLENLIMNAKETDRRTRSGGRAVRATVDRAPAKAKRSAAKSKGKEADPDGPDDEAKAELYRQLCILSYQLQADLDMVPVQSLEQLRARFATPPPADQPMSTDSHTTDPGASAQASRPPTPQPPAQDYDRPQMSGIFDAVTPEPMVKTEPLASPQLKHAPVSEQRPPFSPESSPEVALMHTARTTDGYGRSHLAASYTQGPYPMHDYEQHQSYSWRPKMDSIEDEPMSPVQRPARGNVMSISALMSGPSPVKARSPSPPPVPEAPCVPLYMQNWTNDDEMASQILQACAAAIPKLDTTELDRLTKIAQLAAFDLPPPWEEGVNDVDSPASECVDQRRKELIDNFDPGRLNPLDSLDTEELYAHEEAGYLEEMQAKGDLYESIRYLSNFDEVVDEWRAGELSRLRLQLEMRKAEIERIWTCDRKLAWSNYVNDRAGELYRKSAYEANHERWQAEMELDLLAVQRRKTRGFAKLTHNVWVPKTVDLDDADSVDLYKRFGRFLSASRYAEVEDPLVRSDLRKMQEALRVHKRKTRRSQHAQAHTQEGAQSIAEASASVDEAVAEHAMSTTSTDASESEDEYDSDSSYMSSESGISSLPSWSSVFSSPRLRSVADGDVVISDADALASAAVSLRGAESDSDGDADESLWARQLRLANQSAASGEPTAASAAASGLQTPAEADGLDAGGSVESSRGPSPAPSSKPGQDQSRERKRKRKKPPPPGARLWKKGRVQQDAPDEVAEERAPSMDPGSKPYVAHQDDGRRDERNRPPSSPKPVSHRAEPPQTTVFEPNRYHDMRPGDARSDLHAMPSYGGYGARPEFGFERNMDLERERALHDGYGHPGYPGYQHGYRGYQEPPMRYAAEDVPMPDALYPYQRITPAREMHASQYAYPYPPHPRSAAYPPANPPPPQPPSSQWRY